MRGLAHRPQPAQGREAFRPRAGGRGAATGLSVQCAWGGGLQPPFRFHPQYPPALPSWSCPRVRLRRRGRGPLPWRQRARCASLRRSAAVRAPAATMSEPRARRHTRSPAHTLTRSPAHQVGTTPRRRQPLRLPASPVASTPDNLILCRLVEVKYLSSRQSRALAVSRPASCSRTGSCSCASTATPRSSSRRRWPRRR